MKTYLQAITFFTLVLMSINVSYAQKGKIERANKEFDKYAYIDAREVYLKVVEDGYSSAEIYKRLGDTYYYNSDYQNASIWYSKLVSEFPDKTDAEYYYRAAQSLKSEKRYSESDALMETYIAKGGEGLIAQNFRNNPNYLQSIAEGAKEYFLDKVGVNSSSSDFGPSFYGDKLVFATNSQYYEGAKLSVWDNLPYLDLYQADMDERGVLSNATRLDGEINTEYHESTTTFTKDGNTVYFTRNNFLDDKKGTDKSKTIRLKLYKATKSGDSWGNIVELPFNDDGYSVAHPALSLDEKRLYFSSDMDGGQGESDLWYVDLGENDSYGEPVNLGSSINTEARETFPFISDGNNLYFSSDGRSGLGGLDIFVTPLDNEGNPGTITNLGEPANSNKDDFGFIFNEQKHLGYLTSNREGDGGGSVDDDIYLVEEKCVITISGVVTDKDSGELVPGALVSLLDDNNKLIDQVTVGESASFSFIADCEAQYSVRGTKDRYAPDEKVIETPNKTGSINVPLQLKLIDPCPPNDLGCRLSLQPIYFDFDRYNIREDAAIELAKILAAMREYPQLIIHIESHTDSRGNDSYNKILSEKRAQSTLSWLVDQGIGRSRLSAKGYGESQLVNQCSNGVECTEEEHQLNRRSMFIIQN